MSYFLIFEEALRIVREATNENNIKETIEEALEEIFITEYQKVVRDNVELFNRLAKEHGVEKIIGFLAKQPLYKWKKEAKRIE